MGGSQRTGTLSPQTSPDLSACSVPKPEPCPWGRLTLWVTLKFDGRKPILWDSVGQDMAGALCRENLVLPGMCPHSLSFGLGRMDCRFLCFLPGHQLTLSYSLLGVGTLWQAVGRQGGGEDSFCFSLSWDISVHSRESNKW